jgi:hypothetical protein
MKFQLLQFKLLVMLLTFFMNLHYSSATDFYVSPLGIDKNPGTINQPFLTITHARNAVRELIKQGLKENITVYIRNGVYRITEPLVYGKRDSGNEEFSITYTAFENETPIISGGQTIDGWKKRSDGLLQAKVPEKNFNFRELFVNGKRAIRSRHPNEEYFHVVKPSEDRMSYFFFKPLAIPEEVTADGLELVFIHDWSISRVPVAKIDFEKNLLYPVSKIGRQHFMMIIDGYEKHPRYFLENSPKFCDEPGEWCFVSDKEIIYYPALGETIEQIEAVVPVAEKLMIVHGKAHKNLPLRNLHFKGLIFEHCAYPLPESGYAGVQATFFTNEEWDGVGNYVTPAVEFEMVENCSFENGIIRHVDGAGISFGRQCTDCSLTGSIINDVGGNGVMVGEARRRKRGDDQWWGKTPEQASSRTTIKNNLIENCGSEYFGAVGIWVGFANKTEILHNEIRNLPYTGVSLGWIWNPTPTPCKGNIVANNHIHHVMQILSDGGGIYTLGFQPGTVLRGNYIHDVPVNLGRAESNGMFLDEGTTGIVIEENVIHNTARSPLRFHKAGKNIVRENILAVKESIPHIRYNNTKEKNITQINNTIINSDTDSVHQLSEKISKILESVGIELHYRNKLLKHE